MTASVLLAVMAAFCLGLAALLQQRAASSQSPHPPLSPLLIRHLLEDRVWIFAVGVMVLGYGCQAAALGLGQLSVVEPILAGYLVVAFLIAWLWTGLHISRRSVAAAVATSLGIATFVVVADPRSGRGQAAGASWTMVLLGLSVVLAGGAVLGSRLSSKSRAAVLALVAGIALGCSDALTKQTLSSFSQEGVGAFATWPVYLLVAVGAVAFLAQQSAYHAGPLASSLPVLSAIEPLVGVLLGVVLFQESPRAHGLLSLSALILALLAMGWGIRQLGRQSLAVSAAEAPAPSRDAVET